MLNFVIYYPFYNLHDSHYPPIIGEIYNTHNYEPTTLESECAVCLCKVQEEDEIEMLRCGHMYHKDCLDKWVGFKNHTCPLCRESLRPKRVITEIGAEVLAFDFWTVREDRDREDWWLR